MTLSYLYNDEWHEQDAYTMMFQSAHNALTMLSNPKIPSCMIVDGGYICSKSIYSRFKRDDKKAVTYDTLLKKCPKDITLAELFKRKMYVDHSTGQASFK